MSLWVMWTHSHFVQIKWKLGKSEYKKSIGQTPIPGDQIPKRDDREFNYKYNKKNHDRPFLKTLTHLFAFAKIELPSDIAPYSYDGGLIVLLINCFIILLRFIIYCRFVWRHYNRGVSYIFYLNSIFEYFTRDMKCISIFT